MLNRKIAVDYHAIPHAVFSYPEITSVRMKERDAVGRFSRNGILIGFERYENTTKGETMNAKDYSVKVILEKHTLRILGARMIGPQTSVSSL